MINNDILVVEIGMDELKKRKTPRYQIFDYNSAGVYFITICTQNRRCLLSHIVGTGVLDCPRVEPSQTVGTGVSPAGSGTSGSDSPPDCHSTPSVSLRYLKDGG